MIARGLLTLVAVMMTSFVVTVTNGMPLDLDAEDYEVLADNEAKSVNKDSSDAREVRCFCNEPECVPQGYMCRGKKCFTELPSRASTPLSRAEHSTHSGCLDESFKNRQCPAGFLCCDQDLCNHVDSPAMRNRLNKTLQVLIGGQRAYLAPLQPNNHGSQTTDSLFTTTTATIIVATCGFLVMLLIASLAVRWLRPVPVQTTNKFVPHRTPDNGPPLLGPPKVPLV